MKENEAIEIYLMLCTLIGVAVTFIGTIFLTMWILTKLVLHLKIGWL
jgi:hypothetical protein